AGLRDRPHEEHRLHDEHGREEADDPEGDPPVETAIPAHDQGFGICDSGFVRRPAEILIPDRRSPILLSACHTLFTTTAPGGANNDSWFYLLYCSPCHPPCKHRRLRPPVRQSPARGRSTRSSAMPGRRAASVAATTNAGAA